MTWVMGTQQFVAALYRACLRREPDAEGLAAWSARLEATGDPTAVLAGFMQSREYVELIVPPRRRERAQALATIAVGELGRRPRIVDIGAQSLGAGTHPYSPLAEFTPLDVVGFDPLSDRLLARKRDETGAGSLTLLPYALGDGAAHTLHINNDDATSSLFPLEPAVSVFNHLESLRTVHSQTVETRRLDDVLPPGPVDLMKLDVQGAELMVLQHAHATLADTAAVYCEVQFSPLYESTPVFSRIDDELRGQGFYLVDFPVLTRYHYASSGENASPDRLLWGDALFFKEQPTPDQARAQALIAAGMFGKVTLAARLLALD